MEIYIFTLFWAARNLSQYAQQRDLYMLYKNYVFNFHFSIILSCVYVSSLVS
jgi:hypothetical protein